MNLTRFTKDHIRRVRSHWPTGFSIATAFLAVIAGCQSEIASPGTTDETNTARIVGPGGSSAPGAEVLVFALGDTTRTPILVDTTDEAGGYDPTRLRDGMYNMMASKGDLELFRDSILLGPGATPRVDTLTRPGSLEGRVVLEPGHDPRTVYVRAMGTNLYVNVGEDGSFEFPRIAKGEYTLLATTTLPKYTPTFLPVRAYEDSTVVLAKPIRLVYTGKDLRIHRPDGSRAAEALIRIFKPGDTSGTPVFTAVADRGGRYEMPGLPVGIYNIMATSEDLALFRDSVLLSGNAERADTLGHRGSLRGRVQLEPGDDPRKAVVRVPGTDLMSDVDSAGGFIFPRLPAGDFGMVISVILPDYTPTPVRVTAIDDSAVVLRDPIRVDYSGQGPRLVLPNGTPAAGAEIKFVRNDGLSQSVLAVTVADRGGRYAIPRVPNGRYNLVAKCGDFVLIRESIIGGSSVGGVDTLGHPGSVRGTVEIHPGVDPRSLTVQMVGTGLWSSVDSAGGFFFPEVAAGKHKLIASTDLPSFRFVPLDVQAFADSAVIVPQALGMEYFGPPVVQDLRIVYDTLRGLVRLTWPRTAGATGYQVLRPPNGTWGSSPQSVVLAETTFVDTVMLIAEFGYSTASLLPPAGGTYRVCAMGEGGAMASQWACPGAEVRPPVPMFEGRHSGMRWSKMASLPWVKDYGRSLGYTTDIDLSIQTRRDSLWLFVHRGDNGLPQKVRNRISAWKSADGVHWELVEDSLKVDTWWTESSYWMGGRQMPQFWNDTLWGLRRVADTLQLVGSVDGRNWEEVPLPRKYFVNEPHLDIGWGSTVFPTLLATANGLIIFFETLWEPDQMGCLRDAQGRWQEPATRLDWFYQAEKGHVEVLWTTSGIWKTFRFSGLGYQKDVLETNWIERLDGPSPGHRRPLPRGFGPMVELDGLIYLTTSRYNASTSSDQAAFFVTRKDVDAPWWYADGPEGTSHIKAFAWKDKILAVAENGDLWAGEPTAAP